MIVSSQEDAYVPHIVAIDEAEQLGAVTDDFQCALSPSSHLTPTALTWRYMAGMYEMTNRACFVAGEAKPRPPRPQGDPRRPSQQLGRAPHAWGARAHVRPTCTLCGTLYVCAVTVGSRRKNI